MIKKLKSLRPDTLVYDLTWVVGEAEIASIEPEMKKIENKYGKVKLMIGLDAKGETLPALMEEFVLGIKHWNKIDKIAFVGEKKWWKPLIAMDNLFTKFDEKYFDISQIEDAWNWLGKNNN